MNEHILKAYNIDVSPEDFNELDESKKKGCDSRNYKNTSIKEKKFTIKKFKNFPDEISKISKNKNKY